jgi:hypothetical protein
LAQRKYEVDFIESPSVSKSEMEPILTQIFGKANPTLIEIYCFAIFLEEAYLHENDHPLINLLNLQFDHVSEKASVDLEGINVMHILVNPQEVNVSKQAQPESSESKDARSQIRCGFSYSEFRVQTTSDPLRDDFAPSGSFKNMNVKEVLEEKWISVCHTCNLPYMNLTQPLGFCLKRNISDKRIFVYIYLSLVTKNINQRKLFSNEKKLSHKERDGIVYNMTTGNEVREKKTVYATPIMIHPYKIDKLNGQLQASPDNLELSSPLANTRPEIIDSSAKEKFANGNVVAKLLPSDFMENLILNVTGSEQLQDVFNGLPNTLQQKQQIGSMVYAVLLYVNFGCYMNQKYDNFKSGKCYDALFNDLNDRISFFLGYRIPSIHKSQSNFLFVCRLMFRFIAKDLGIMIPEGNGRNYSACLSFARCRDANVFINSRIPRERALPFPNLEYISPEITCEYVIQQHIESITEPVLPYDENVQKQFLALSVRSYNNSQSGEHNFCHHFAYKFFFNKVMSSMKEENKPLETRDKWPEDFKEKLARYLEGKENNFENLVMSEWLKSKKLPLLDELKNATEIMNIVVQDYRSVTAVDTGKTIQECVIQHIGKSFVENPVGTLYLTNIVKVMSVYLCGLSCDNGDLLFSLGNLVKSNGVIGFENSPKEDEFTLKLFSPWIDDLDKQRDFSSKYMVSQS